MLGHLLHPFLTFILVFMGQHARMRNPHMRAHMAEGLEALLPSSETDEEEEPANTSKTTYAALPILMQTSVKILFDSSTCRVMREKLFKDHPHIEQVASTLLSVFCNIEMTGQAVDFDEKFSYRRPMYKILKYLWSQEVHRSRLKVRVYLNCPI